MRLSLRMIALGTAITFMICTAPLWSNPADPLSGTWELNVAASKFEPGPGPQSQKRIYESDGNTVKMVLDGVDSEGKPAHSEYAASYDGKDYPMTGNPNAETIALKRIDDLTAEATLKKGGSVFATSTRVISKDGKTMTITTTGKNAKGDFKNTLVFDKK